MLALSAFEIAGAGGRSLGTFLVSRKLVGSMTQTQGKGVW